MGFSKKGRRTRIGRKRKYSGKRKSSEAGNDSASMNNVATEQATVTETNNQNINMKNDDNDVEDDLEDDTCENLDESNTMNNAAVETFQSNAAIAHLFQKVYHNPPPEKWSQKGGVICKIKKTLLINHKTSIQHVCERLWFCYEHGIEFNPQEIIDEGNLESSAVKLARKDCIEKKKKKKVSETATETV